MLFASLLRKNYKKVKRKETKTTTKKNPRKIKYTKRSNEYSSALPTPIKLVTKPIITAEWRVAHSHKSSQGPNHQLVVIRGYFANRATKQSKQWTVDDE